VQYRDVVSRLFALGKFARTPGMIRMVPLLDAMGCPQKSFDVLHVGGTNGKGSTCAFLDAMLRSTGQDTALFTSPHLHTIRERIRVNGQVISRDAFASIGGRVLRLCAQVEKDTGEHPTFFEILTAIMYQHAADRSVRYLVQEVGLGGRYDATNVVSHPLVTVITDVDLDHTEVLGTTLEEIAGEKAGIVKEGVRVVVGPLRREAWDVVADVAIGKDAPITSVLPAARREHRPRYGISWVCEAGAGYEYHGVRWQLPDVRIRMLGGHQVRNSALALAAIEAVADDVGVDANSALSGLARATWPGRVEVVNREPLVVLDGAHNASGAKVFAESLEELFPGRTIHAVVGIMDDKDARSMLAELAPLIDGEVYATRAPLPRARCEKQLALEAADALIHASAIHADSDPLQAVETILGRAAPEDVIIVWGSLYLVGTVRGRWVSLESL